ncbi:tandem-95 repeat protein [Candidatus Woesearchaeota archaeon]|nr:tandem-95 repeat protein [Candidatus Woesearchaeota archaeon]
MRNLFNSNIKNRIFVLLIILALLISSVSMGLFSKLAYADGTGGDDGGSDGTGGDDGGSDGTGGDDIIAPVEEIVEIPIEMPVEPTTIETTDVGAEGGEPVNNPPILDSIGNKQVNENQLLQFAISGSDPDNNAISFSASNLPTGAVLNGQIFSWTPSFNQAGNYQITFTVSDGLLTDSEVISVIVNNVNRIPVINALPNQNVNEDNVLNNAFDLDNFASDLDGDSLSYSVNSNNNIVVTINSNNQVSFAPKSNFNGQETITFTVSDGSLTGTNSLTLTVNSVNDNPLLVIPDVNFDEDTTLSFDLDNFVSDPDILTNNDKMTFSISGNNQIAVSLSPDNIVKLTPNANFNGQEIITFRATDLNNAFSVDNVIVKINPVNDNPVLKFIQKIFLLAGDKSNQVDLNLDNFATDVDIATNNDKLSYSSSQKQNSAFNVAINNNLAAINAQNPSIKTNSGLLYDGIIYERTSETVTFKATDLNGGSGSDDLTLTIGNAPHAIISYNNLNIREEEEFELSSQRSFDLDGKIVLFQWDLGDGTTSTKETVKHSYNKEGNYKVKLTVTDDDGLSNSQTITMNVGIQLNKQHKFSISTKFNDLNDYNSGDEYENYIKLRNIGNLNEKNIQSRLIIDSLEINQNLETFNLEPYQVKWIPVIFDIPENAQRGEHLARISIENRNFQTFGYFTIFIE